jgi:hypothetical protein
MSIVICCKNCLYTKPCFLCEDHSQFFHKKHMVPEEITEVKFLGSTPVLNRGHSPVDSKRRSNRHVRDMRER